jgi:hypothetical protein
VLFRWDRFWRELCYEVWYGVVVICSAGNDKALQTERERIAEWDILYRSLEDIGLKLSFVSHQEPRLPRVGLAYTIRN